VARLEENVRAVDVRDGSDIERVEQTLPKGAAYDPVMLDLVDR
jgi:hypothetical protein